MDTATVGTDVLEAPAVVETTPEPESVSIADHAEQFDPNPKVEPSLDKPAANTGQFADRETRRRAGSQRATPEDVAEINRLTRELRETEQRLGDKDPDAAVSPRIRTLKRQLAALKALETPAQASTPAPAVREEPVKTTQPRTVAAPPTGELRAKPTEDEIGSKYATYADFVEDVADWKLEKWQHEQTAKQAESSATEEKQRIYQAHASRMSAFEAQTPDFQTKAGSFLNQQIPNLLIAAIVSDDNGPAYVYHLAQHPEVADAVFLDTAYKPVDAASVAVVQRRLAKLIAAGTTGAAPPAKPVYSPPRPPTPVRTGPVKTADEPPAEAASVAEHAKHFSPRR